MLKSKKFLIMLGIMFLGLLFYCSDSQAYSWPVADNNGEIDYKTTYIEYGYGRRRYRVDNSKWKDEGSYLNTENHYGIDITGNPNETYKIVSVSNGTVLATSADRVYGPGISFQNNNQRKGIHSRDGGGYGNYILIKDKDTDFVFMYAHLAPNTINLKKGDSVNIGQVIGTMGSSGDSGHMHLHFEIRRNSYVASANTTKYDYQSNNSETINPVRYIYTYQMTYDYVRELYKTILGRDTGEDNSWIDKIMKGELSQSQVLKNIINSREFRNKNCSNEDYVEILYKSCYLRGSNYDAKRRYVQLLNSGTSRNNILNEFLNSAEYKNLCTTYYARDFISNLYKGIYGENLDSVNLSIWTKIVDTGTQTPAQAISSLYNSKQFVQNNFSNIDYVRKLYNGCLLRDANINSDNSHVRNLNNGVSRQQVLKNFVNSVEYRNLVAKKYGLTNIGL